MQPMMGPSPISSSSTRRIAVLSTPRILSEHLALLSEPLACLLTPGAEGLAPPAAVAALGARALLDLPAVEDPGRRTWPDWLAPHQVAAAERLTGIIARYHGALLADAVGLGKSYVALAVALAFGEPFALVVPAVLVPQWNALLASYGASAPVITHESLSASPTRCRPLPPVAAHCRLFVVDEAHRFRNPGTRRYRALAPLVVNANVLLVTATPVHNRVGDLCHLFRLFLRDHDLTALGVPSLLRAARGDCDARALMGTVARLSVSRSRGRARAGYRAGAVALAFPERVADRSRRIGCAPDPVLEQLVARVTGLEAGRDAAALFRLVLLSQLASSLPAFRASLSRYDAFLDLGAAAAAEGKELGRHDFRRLFPAGTEDLQLVFLPLLLPSGAPVASERDRDLVRRLREVSRSPVDPKADALVRLLDEHEGKTIVFVNARATLHHLMRHLRGRRVAGVAGDRGWFGTEPAGRHEVIQAFAPRAQGAPAPSAALATDVLIATDLLSEGLNLQDAVRVVHYDLPWSPARLAQREGRIDRAASPHARIETIAFLPPRPLADALAVERRLALKRRAQARAGGGRRGLDWCDRLQQIATSVPSASLRSWGFVVAPERAVVLVIRIEGRVEAFVATDAGVRADPERATALLERAAGAELTPVAAAHRSLLDLTIRQAVPLCRRRLDAIEAARWRAADRDRLSRRLIPWVLAAARRAAVQRRPAELLRLDGLVSRLALGMTAGEELLLEELVARRATLSIRDVLAWHERLPARQETQATPQIDLVTAVVFAPA
jgi:superfamily II DNA or RNA helicase